MGCFPVVAFSVVLILLLPRLGETISGSNVCPTETGQNACCYNYYEVDGRCVECELGYYGDQCKSECYPGFYGRQCKNRCDCKPLQNCDPKEGCRCRTGDQQCEGKTSTPSTTTTRTTTTLSTTTKKTTPAATTTFKPTTSKYQIVTTTKSTLTTGQLKGIKVPKLPSSIASVTTVTENSGQYSNNSLSKFVQEGIEDQSSSIFDFLGKNLITVIAICSSGIAAFLIVVVLVIFIRSKVKKKQKRKSTGRANEHHPLSVMSKVYDEINDSLVRPSCSNERPRPSCEGAAGGYESLAGLKSKSLHEKGNRGSYEMLDEATKGLKIRENYQVLDETTTAPKVYEGLNTRTKETDYSSLTEVENKVNGTKLKVSLDTIAKTDDTPLPEYTQVVRRKKSKDPQNKYGKNKGEVAYTVPDDYLKPLPVPRRMTDDTKGDESQEPIEIDQNMESTKMILEVDGAPGRQMTKSITNFSYEIPPLPSGKKDVKKSTDNAVKNPKETRQKEPEKSNIVEKKENSNISKNAVLYTEQEKIDSSQAYDDSSKPLNPKDRIKKTPIKLECQSYDVPPERITSFIRGSENRPVMIKSEQKSDFDAPLHRSGVNDNAQGGDLETANYDVPPTKKENDASGNYDTPPARNDYDRIPNGKTLGNLAMNDNDGISSCDYDVPPAQCVEKNESSRQGNYDVPPPKN